MVQVELRDAFRLLNHGATTLIASAHEGRRNVMAAQWVMPLDFNPPKFAVVIDSNTYTRKLVEASGELVINVPLLAQADLVWTVGSTSGQSSDKFADFNIATLPSQVVGPPCIAGCAAWLECKVVQAPYAASVAEALDLFVVEVVAARAAAGLWQDRCWNFSHEVCTMHHTARGSFFRTGETQQARLLESNERH